ncbi:hypothetical protein [Candidatus Albibeggiatoa sp. nov. BB20]|uniref:hypothetical protein n=1 Tax=Candidatus Albibeggiatoa sp. nov. BB20 TaxID=3162723 RepID=UPI003365754D
MRYPFYALFLLSTYGFFVSPSFACEVYYDPVRFNLSLPCLENNQNTFDVDLTLEQDRLPEISFVLANSQPVIEPPVRWQITDLGMLLADARGLTLYTFTNDTPNHSNCTEACLEKWPPLLADVDIDKNSMTQEGFSLITRDDNRLQWSYHSKPLYYWFQDVQVGDTLGNNINDVWHVVKSTHSHTQYKTTGIGTVLAAANNITLYTFDNDAINLSNCNDDCASRWPPLVAHEKSRPDDGYSILTRADGTLQWSYEGQPLYFWFEDQNSEDTLGDDIGGVWHVLHQNHAATEFAVTSIGTVMTASNGLTLYTFDKDQANKSNCNDDCASHWPALKANEFAQNQGLFTVMTRDDGSYQWAYRGKPLYFWFEDQNKEDTLGNGVGEVWHVIYR